MNESGYYKEIINKLEKLTKKEYILVALLGIQTSLIVSLAAFVLFSFSEMIGHFSSIVTIFFYLPSASLRCSCHDCLHLF